MNYLHYLSCYTLVRERSDCHGGGAGQLGSNPPDTEHEDVPDTSKPVNSSASSSAEQMNTAGVSTATRGTDNTSR